LYDFTLHVGSRAAREELNDLLVESSHGVLHNIIGTDDTCKVSSDFIKNRHSATIDLPLTEVLDGRCVKITAWQDNEYGYAYQLVAMARHLFAERTEAV
jgi:glyceraldehyde 3-phosphate dehydrogenase